MVLIIIIDKIKINNCQNTIIICRTLFKNLLDLLKVKYKKETFNLKLLKVREKLA